ncbi:MAG: type II toxin-antitoxin system VapC family toxin [Prolixibacteraceae bacterium]|jgi:predicted nucleic acid-binding protein
MEKSGMVVDTSIFIEFLRAGDKTKTSLFLIPDDAQIFISSVTLYELLMGAITPDKLTDIKMLTEEIAVLPFNEDVANKAAEIYHQLRKLNKMIEFRDIFIAATCIVNNLPVKTLNTKHFDRIIGLGIA